MEERYYDAWEFAKANNYVETDPKQANLKLKEYLEKYPKDYATYGFYAGSFINLGDFESAEKIIKYVEKLAREDSQFNKQPDKVKMFKRVILFDKFRLFCYQGKYDKLIKMCGEYRKLVQEWSLNDLDFYCKKKLNRIPDIERDNNTYLFRQMIEYKEEDLLDHLKKHSADFNQDLDNPNDCVFVPGFPIKELVDEVKKYIPSDKKICHGFYDDLYVFKCKECGRINNKLVDYFKVSCFHDSGNIITIYPASRCEKLPLIDLSYFNKKEEKKVTIVSARDKFNKRYGRK